jgi:hypothetical protein
MLEFGVSQPEIDEVRAEWDFMVGYAECDFVEKDLHQSSPWPRLLVRQRRTSRVDFDFEEKSESFYTGYHQRSTNVSCICGRHLTSQPTRHVSHGPTFQPWSDAKAIISRISDCR